MSRYADEFSGILEKYRQDLQKLESESRPGDGLFGFGRKKEDHPCHTAMDQAAEALCTRLAGDPEADSQEASGLLRLLLEAASACPWPDHARWMLIAAQRHGMLLVPRLSPEDAEDIAGRFAAAVNRRDRVPVQETLMKALRRRAEQIR